MIIFLAEVIVITIVVVICFDTGAISMIAIYALYPIYVSVEIHLVFFKAGIECTSYTAEVELGTSSTTNCIYDCINL